jgi:hypothetical protein
MRNGLFFQKPNDKLWYKNDVLHNEDGPAIERENGFKAYYINGVCHRIDGPAKTYSSGKEYWYFNDMQYSEEEHPYTVFRNEYNLLDNYHEWPTDMKVLFKLTFGGI